MVDLYMVIVPIFGAIALLNLLVLKLSIKEVVTISKIRHSQLPNRERAQKQEESPTKSTVKHMLLHFTPIQICAVRRAKYKICLLLSISLISLCTYFMPSPYFFIITGTVVYFGYFFVSMAITQSSSEEKEQENAQKSKEKYLQVIMTVLSIALNFTMIGIVYKMYLNSVLLTFLGNVALNIVIDNFAVRPIAATILAIPLSFNSSINSFIIESEKEEEMLEIYEAVGERQMLTRVEKMMSASKIAKNIPLQVNIQKPDSNTYMRQGEEKHMDILKKIKKEKLLPPINMNLQQADQQFSLNSLFTSGKKEENSNASEAMDGQLEEEKISNEEPILPVKSKGGSQNLIMINPSQQEEINNEEDIQTEHIGNRKITENDEEDNESFRQKGATFNVGDSNEPLRISLNDSENPTSRQEPLRICLNGQINLDFQDDRSDEDEDIDNYRKRKDLMTLDDATNKNPNFGLLEIKQKNHMNQSEEIEEIDLNSPQRRRRQGLHVEYEVDSKMSAIPKKKKKKLSHDNPRIVKYSTGEPYLQYLPNMLSKDAKTKKSQAISRKQLIMDSRIVSSVKRPPKRKVFGQHNENVVPEFNIEEI